MLSAEVARRRRRPTGPAGPTPGWPNADDRLVLLVDEYATFRAVFERVDGGRYTELLDALIRDGRAAGLHCVVTTSQRRDLQGLVASAIPRRLVLRPDRQDQEALGLGRQARGGGELPPGRGFLDELEVQVAAPGDGMLDQLAARPARCAPPVAILPEDLRRALLPPASGPWRAVVGLGGDAVAPVEIDLSRGHLLVAGPRGSGRTTTLAALAASLAGGPHELMLLTARRESELASLVPWSRSALGAEACAAFAESMEAGPRPTVVLVDDADTLAEGGSDAALRRLARMGRDLPLRFVAAVETRALRRYSEWLGELRECRHAVLLNPDVSCDGEPFGVGQLPRPLRAWPPGRGFLVCAGNVTPLHVAR
jgi:S-DNA-T family DNA segregation ATPase FtsK/SpoIIIE